MTKTRTAIASIVAASVATFVLTSWAARSTATPGKTTAGSSIVGDELTQLRRENRRLMLQLALHAQAELTDCKEISPTRASTLPPADLELTIDINNLGHPRAVAEQAERFLLDEQYDQLSSFLVQLFEVDRSTPDGFMWRDDDAMLPELAMAVARNPGETLQYALHLSRQHPEEVDVRLQSGARKIIAEGGVAVLLAGDNNTHVATYHQLLDEYEQLAAQRALDVDAYYAIARLPIPDAARFLADAVDTYPSADRIPSELIRALVLNGSPEAKQALETIAQQIEDPEGIEALLANMP